MITLKIGAKPKNKGFGFVDEMVLELAKTAGEGTTQLLGSDGLAIKIRGVLSTQCPTVDGAIGRGGVPLGRLTIINGPESSGKTTLALHLVAECQRQGGKAIYIDSEHKLDPEYAKAIGVNTEELIISQPPYLEKCFAVMECATKLMKKHRETTGERLPLLIMLDSMNASISKAEFDGDWEDQQMAAQARVFSRSLPKLIPIISQEDVALVFISQIREKIGVMWGNKEELSGGRGPKFYASLILNVRRKSANKDSTGNRHGDVTEVYVSKNQIAPPFKTASFDIVYGKGIDFAGSLLDRVVALKLVSKKGNWFVYKGMKLGQGEKQAATALRKNDKLMQKFKDYVVRYDQRTAKTDGQDLAAGTVDENCEEQAG